MRRALVALVAGVAALVPVAAAHAAQESPAGTFTSPNRAVAGAPIFVRSITPCPVSAGAYRYVRVGISPQSQPDSLAYIESTDGDLRADGSWEVTLSAPSDMANGITKSFEIQAQCLENDAPYAAPPRDSSVTETTLPPTFSMFRYSFRSLYVTGFGTADAEPAGEATDPTSTTTSSSTTTTQPLTTPNTALTSAGLTAQSATADSAPSVKVADRPDAQARADAIRAELEAQGVDTSSLSDHEVLLAAPVAASRPAPEPSGGMPWWTFVLVTMLVAGAVVAFGARRSTSSL